MKKVIISIAIFATLLIGVIFANSYVKALSEEERLQMNKEKFEQKVQENKNCDYFCQQNENYPICQQNDNCLQQNKNSIRNCARWQKKHNRK